MDIESIFFTIFIIWYFKNYIPEDTINILYSLHGKATQLLNVYNSVMYPLYFSLDEKEEIKEETTEKEEEEVKSVEPKPEIIYEDKFLEDIRKMNKEYIFDDDEKVEEGKKFIELLNKASDERVYQISQINDKMAQIERYRFR